MDVIPISTDLDDASKSDLWPYLSTGGIYVDSVNIYIPTKNKLYVQSLIDPAVHTTINFEINGSDKFRIRKVVIDKNRFYFTIFLFNGRFYLYSTDKNRDNTIGPVDRHGNSQGLALIKHKYLVASGNYRPAYSMFLDRYDTNTLDGDTQSARDHFKYLNQHTHPYSLSVYALNLKLLDSLNMVDRDGDHAAAFENLYVKQPLFVLNDSTIFTCDNSAGYVINSFTYPSKDQHIILLHNSHFKALPQHLDKAVIKELRSTPNSYSQVYILFVSDSLMLTSFFTSPTAQNKPEPPYYYDLTKMNGQKVVTGSLDYPIVAHNSKDHIYLLVRQAGGWFEDDRYYFVGMTLTELLKHGASKERISQLIDTYKAEHLDDE